MNSRRASDPLWVEIHALLQSLAEKDGIVAGPASGPWHGHDPMAGGRGAAGRWPLSATEMLLAWSPPGGEPTAATWDRYLPPTTTSFEPDARVEERRIVVAREQLFGDGNELEEAVDSRGAAAAVDRLFELVHALEQRDVEAVLSGVAEDFHAFDGRREVDRRTLRQQVEQFVDQRRHGPWRVSLTEVPHPVVHPGGILIRVTFQVDSVDGNGAKQSELLSRVAVFGETSADRWQLCGLADVG